MMKKYIRGLFGTALCFGLLGCATEEVDASHRARMFERTGIWALYAGGEG